MLFVTAYECVWNTVYNLQFDKNFFGQPLQECK